MDDLVTEARRGSPRRSSTPNNRPGRPVWLSVVALAALAGVAAWFAAELATHRVIVVNVVPHRGEVGTNRRAEAVGAPDSVADRGAHHACIADFKSVETAQEAYFAGNVEYAKSMVALVEAGFLHQGSSSDSYAVQTDSSGTVYASTTMNMIPVPVPAAVATQTTTAFCPPEMDEGSDP